MKEIKVEEYIRTELGDIKKITKGFEFIIERHNKSDNKIVKHSKEIIDLIEVGDYVNGYKVLDVVEDMKTGELHLEMPMDYTNQELGDCTIYNKDIKTIITKEQIKQIEYRIKE